MAHSLSAKKRVRQNERARARNRTRKETIKQAVKGFLSAVTHGDLGKAATELKAATRALDKVAAKGTIHKNTAARKRSRLAKRLNVATKAAAAKTTSGTGGKSKA